MLNQVVHQVGVAVNEALRHLGIQVLKAGEVDELKFFVIPGIAGAMRLPRSSWKPGPTWEHDGRGRAAV